jgi:hypothetical protein
VTRSEGRGRPSVNGGRGRRPTPSKTHAQQGQIERQIKESVNLSFRKRSEVLVAKYYKDYYPQLIDTPFYSFGMLVKLGLQTCAFRWQFLEVFYGSLPARQLSSFLANCKL